ncbi:pentapeptide repeat-containing protein [Oscillospiraceae bacterium 21-37]
MGADLRGVDLRKADLQGANLRGANLDYSCWPLWCGSLDVKVDVRLAAQLVCPLLYSPLSHVNDALPVLIHKNPPFIIIYYAFPASSISSLPHSSAR